MLAAVTPAQAKELARYLLEEYRACLRPPVDRFRHPWVAPMPLSLNGRAYLEARAAGLSMLHRSTRSTGSDGFTSGDYSLGLFHHDASEAAIELFEHEAFRAGAAGSLLNLLDCADPDGRVHRVELPHKSRELEPSKPVIAQYALRAVRTMGVAWAEEHRVFERALAFIRFTEAELPRAPRAVPDALVAAERVRFGPADRDAARQDRGGSGHRLRSWRWSTTRSRSWRGCRAGRFGVSAEGGDAAENLERLCWYEDEHGGFYVALRWQHGAGALESEIISARGAAGNAAAG